MSNEISLLTGQRLEKSFASRTLFQDLSFGIPSKARIGLVGANGAGKSTLLRIHAGQVSPDHCEVVTIRGLRVALLEQDAQFAEGLTVRDALAEGATRSGLDEHDPPARALSGGGRFRENHRWLLSHVVHLRYRLEALPNGQPA